MTITRHALRRTAAIAAGVSLGAGAIAVAATSNGNGPPDDRGAVRDFTMSGTVAGTLSPGVQRSLPLTVTNPNTQPMTVTEIVVSVRRATSRPGCDGVANLQVTQPNVSAAQPLTVPKKSSVTLPSGTFSAPRVLMRNLPSSQDACRGATFTFDFTGKATS